MQFNCNNHTPPRRRFLSPPSPGSGYYAPPSNNESPAAVCLETTTGRSLLRLGPLLPGLDLETIGSDRDDDFAASSVSCQSPVLQSRFNTSSSANAKEAHTPLCTPLHIDDASRFEATICTPSACSNRQEPIGQGTFGCVRKEWCEALGQYVAQKKIRLGSVERSRSAVTERDFAQRAIEVAERCPHLHVWAHIVEVYEAYFDATTGETVVTMEFMPGGAVDALPEFRHSSAEALPLVSQRRLARVMRDVLLGLQTLHDTLEVLHRDLKPSNILIAADGTAKLADFGVSALLTGSGDEADDQLGSTLYMSPERLRGDLHGPASDVWSAGICALQLLLRQVGIEHPFITSAEEAARARDGPFWHMGDALLAFECPERSASAVASALRRAVEFLRPRVVANELDLIHDFAQAALHVDEYRRATVVELLSHPWIQAVNKL
jgi:serine/threonine protein kinase